MDTPTDFFGGHRTKAISSIHCNDDEHSKHVHDLRNFKVGPENSAELIGWIDAHIQHLHNPEDVVIFTLCLGGSESVV